MERKKEEVQKNFDSDNRKRGSDEDYTLSMPLVGNCYTLLLRGIFTSE